MSLTPSQILRKINDMVVGLKSDNVWDKITEAYLMAGVTFGGITVKLKGTGTLTNNNFVSGDYQATGAGAGLTGNAGSKKITTGITTTSGASFSTYNTTQSTEAISGQSRITLALDNNFGVNIDRRFSGNAAGTQYAIGDSIKNDNWTVGYALNTGTKAFKNGSFDYFSSNTISSSNVYLFGRQVDNAVSVDCSITFAHIGTGLTDTDAANLSLRVNKLMYDLGCNVYNDINTLGDYDEDAQAYFANVFNAGGNFE
jgi:hypothetical protein